MAVQQLIESDDVPPEDLVGAESIHKHLKIYKLLFKTFLTDNKDILEKSPTDGVVAAPSKARFGAYSAYSAAEMRKFVGGAQAASRVAEVDHLAVGVCRSHKRRDCQAGEITDQI